MKPYTEYLSGSACLLHLTDPQDFFFKSNIQFYYFIKYKKIPQQPYKQLPLKLRVVKIIQFWIKTII